MNENNDTDGVEGSQSFVKLSENKTGEVPSLDDGFWKEQVRVNHWYQRRLHIIS
jgi:hypothetical protein